MIFLRDTGRIGTGANQRLYLGNRQSGLLMRLGSLSHLASDLLGLKNRPFERVVHAHSHFPAAKGEYEVPRLAHAHETGFFKPIIWHIRTTFRRKDITSFKYAPRVERVFQIVYPMGEYGADRAIYIDLRTKDDERTMMAQDYDSPRNKDEDEESLQALGKSSQNASSDIDDDENAIAEDYELPGADLSNEDSSVTVIPMQGDEFICSQCFLVKHRSQLAYTDEDGQPVCEECAA